MLIKEQEIVLKRGEVIDIEDIFSRINSIPPDENYADSLAFAFTQIALQKPLITRVAQIGNSNLRTYLIENNLFGDVGNTLFNLIAMFDKSPMNREIILLYENDFGVTREFLHYVNSLDGEHKIPYISKFLTNIYFLKYNKEYQVNGLREILADPHLIPFVKDLAEKVSLKKYAGETNTNCKVYEWILDECVILHDVIDKADCAIDLGGGYATPYLSQLFSKELVSYDIIDPRSARSLDIKFVLPHDITRKDYLRLLDNQPWKYYDVFDNAFPIEHNVYFIASFGCALSTVRTTTTNRNWIQFTYQCFLRVAELVALGKEVYFFFYGRPTVRVNRNKIMAVHMKDKKVMGHYLYKDPFSMNTTKLVGVNHIMARKSLENDDA